MPTTPPPHHGSSPTPLGAHSCAGLRSGVSAHELRGYTLCGLAVHPSQGVPFARFGPGDLPQLGVLPVTTFHKKTVIRIRKHYLQKTGMQKTMNNLLETTNNNEKQITGMLQTKSKLQKINMTKNKLQK